MIKYLGSKRTLIPAILGAFESAAKAAGPIRSVIDLFSGTSRVGYALKGAGYRVLANDHNAYAAALARCYVQADREDVFDDAATLVREFNGLKGEPGYFTSTFCEQSRFFRPENGARVDAIREAIARKGLGPELEAVVLVSLMEAADRVDSTTGVQMAYLKSWAPRAHNDLELRVPVLLPRAVHGKGEAHALDALDAARTLEADAAYIDPPYNQHSYLGNYHVWESLVRWDKPPVYGVACKRADCKERRSDFNLRSRFREAISRLLHSVRARVLIVSFSNEGYITREEMEALLGGLSGTASPTPAAIGAGTIGPPTIATAPRVITTEHDYRRYIGSQIGIYNPRGQKVGKIGHLRNKEFLYVVTRNAEAVAFAPSASPASPFVAPSLRRSVAPATLTSPQPCPSSSDR